MDHKAPMNHLRERLARRELEKSSILALIVSPLTSALQMHRAMSRCVDLDKEIREIVAELRASAAENIALPRTDAPTKPHHRLNRDGTIDSICIRCFATIASSYRVEDLELIEPVHTCDPEAFEMYHGQPS